jgi:hypothetical protein
LTRLKSFFEDNGIRYMLIGGLANTVWGRPRLTYDADVKVLLGDLSIREFGHMAAGVFTFRRSDAIEFARQSYVLLIYAADDVPADLIIGLLPYESQAIERAVPTDIEGVLLPVCTAEDLIIHKAISERERDWIDIEGVLLRQRDRLDQDYVHGWLAQFASSLERPEITERYRDLRDRLGV